jgi:hypothetical protein
VKRLLVALAILLVSHGVFSSEESERSALQRVSEAGRAYEEFLRHPDRKNREGFVSLLSRAEKEAPSMHYALQDAIECRYGGLEREVNQLNYQAVLVAIAVLQFDRDIHFRPILKRLLADYCAQQPETFLKAAREARLDESEVVDLIVVTNPEEGDESIDCARLKARSASLKRVKKAEYLPTAARMLMRLNEALSAYCAE